jgi:hypothetical protein
MEDTRFLRESVVDVNAAVVGISRSRWISVSGTKATAEQAAQIMQANRFDILPVEDPSGVSEYFHTRKWNDYLAVDRRAITHRDVISFVTPLRDVIRGFALEPRDFYFLVSERMVVGLVSLANLNCRQVYVYLFSLLSELEVQLGNLVTRHCSDQKLLETTWGPREDGKYRGVKKRYKSDRALGYDVPFVEYMYLTDLVKVIGEKGLFGQMGYQDCRQFMGAFGRLVKLRNKVAHPNRSLITGPESCKELWQGIDEVEGVLFRLR